MTDFLQVASLESISPNTETTETIEATGTATLTKIIAKECQNQEKNNSEDLACNYQYEVEEEKEALDKESFYDDNELIADTLVKTFSSMDFSIESEEAEGREEIEGDENIIDAIDREGSLTSVTQAKKKKALDYSLVFDNVKLEILSFLNQRDVAKSCRVCKEWRENNQYIQCIQSSNTIGLKVLRENMHKIPRLISLDLWSNWLGDAGSSELANILQEYRLKDLNRLKVFIMASDIRAPGTKYLLEELRRGVCPNLHTLDLNQNSFGDNEVQNLGEVLKTIETKLHGDIMGENNHERGEANEEILKNESHPFYPYRINRVSSNYPCHDPFSSSFSSSTTISPSEKLFFSHLCKTNSFIDSVKRNGQPYSFDTLNLGQNRISEKGLLKFADQMMEAGLPILRYLDLRKNKLDKEAIDRLTQKYPAIHFKV